ncbi:MAG: hypothetical protein KIT43_15935 [Bauldia sp.]|nr:hypothetical protein [Bauldia sp.]
MTVKRMFSSDRNFKIWTYSVSFRRLLLRSNKSDAGRGDAHPTRSEILFFEVAFMIVRPWMQGVTIEEFDPDDVPADIGRLAGAGWPGVDEVKWFRLSAADSVGWVAALAVYFREDDLEYSDPSFLLTNPDGTPGRV